MTTFTTEDRILAEKDGSFTINVEGGTVTSPPHIVDSGASVMNNKPVAWMFQGAFDISTYVSFEKPNADIYPNPTPLYTHPVKELTDEEILQVMINVYSDTVPPIRGVEFARAILRKAQEK